MPSFHPAFPPGNPPFRQPAEPPATALDGNIPKAICLDIVLVACLALAVFLLHGPKDKEAWSTLTAVLAVLAAVIAILPALRILEIQEDALRPRPTPYFDLTSRYDLLQLRVKNLGAGVAYDVRLIWKIHPFNHNGEEIRSLDHISVLLPGESVSTLVGTSHDTVKTLVDTSVVANVP